MTYALRKLIAFVFLLGIFWYVFRDLDNVWDASFQQSVALLVIVFALVWTVVPIVVVFLRSRQRVMRNRTAFDAWCATLPPEGPAPLTGVGSRITLAPDEKAYWIEKGTLYARIGAEHASHMTPGTPGEVAFPGCNRFRRKLQRVRCCLTDRRLVLVGKDLAIDWPCAAVFAKALPGGLLFIHREGARLEEVAFTFQNPLIVRHVFCCVTRHA